MKAKFKIILNDIDAVIARDPATQEPNGSPALLLGTARYHYVPPVPCPVEA